MPKNRAPIGRLFRRLRRILLIAFSVLILLAVGLVAVLRWVDPPISSVMAQRIWSDGLPQHQQWVPLDRISPEMALAVVAGEDQLFPQHKGVDVQQVLMAVEARLDGERLRGASTISQQVARNLFLWQGRSFLRKFLELGFTGLIELLWDKARILEMYLNFAEMGERIFGVGAASHRLLHTDAAHISRQQAALIAAALPNPLKMRIDAPSAYMLHRRDWIEAQMRNLGGVGYLSTILPSTKRR